MPSRTWHFLLCSHSLVLPTADVVTDLLYLMAQTFAFTWLFCISVILFAIPVPHLAWKVMGEEKIFPRLFFLPYTSPFRLWRFHPRMLPFKRLDHYLGFRRIDNIVKLALVSVLLLFSALAYVVIFTLALTAQLLVFLPPFLLLNWHWVLVHLAFVIPMLMMGGLLYGTKLWAISWARARWLSIWTGLPVEPDDKPVVNQTFNEMLIHEVAMESFPQLVIQSYNSYVLHQLGLGAKISIAFSLGAILNTIYKYVRLVSHRPKS